MVGFEIVEIPPRMKRKRAIMKAPTSKIGLHIG